METILVNILIFIVASIVFERVSDQTHKLLKLPKFLMPSILSATLLIFTNVSSIACAYTEYQVADELFAAEGKEDFGMFVLASIICFAICFLTICNFICHYGNFPPVELFAYYKQVDSAFNDTQRISYSTFKKMYKLHPDSFKFIDDGCFTFYSFKYRGKKFSLNFLDFVRALYLVNEYIEEKDIAHKKAKQVKKYEEQSKLYAMMRDDLANDLAVIEKQKADAYDKIKTSTDNINEIANRLIKEIYD